MFLYNKKVTFYDCDPAGIMFFAKIYEVCHAAYEAMIESFELPDDYWNNREFVVPIIRSEASYRKPYKYGEEVIIELNVKWVKSTSFELNYICKNVHGEVCIEVKTIHVFVDKVSWQKTSIKDSIKEGLNKHL